MAVGNLNMLHAQLTKSDTDSWHPVYVGEHSVALGTWTPLHALHTHYTGYYLATYTNVKPGCHGSGYTCTFTRSRTLHMWFLNKDQPCAWHGLERRGWSRTGDQPQCMLAGSLTVAKSRVKRWSTGEEGWSLICVTLSCTSHVTTAQRHTWRRPYHSIPECILLSTVLLASTCDTQGWMRVSKWTLDYVFSNAPPHCTFSWTVS